MAGKLIRSQWERQPVGPVGINSGHPRADGLVFFAPLSGAHGTRDLVKQQLGVRTGLEAYLPSQAGAVHHLFGSSNYVDFSELPDLSASTETTIAWTQEPRSPSAYGAIIALKPTGATYQFTIYTAASDANFYFVVGPRLSNFGTDQATFSANVGALTDQRLDRFVLVLPSGMASVTGARLWRNGVEISRGTSAGTNNFSTNTTAAWRIGALETGSDTFEGLLGDVRIWSRALSEGDAEEESTVQGSWALYQPQRIWVPGAAAGGSFSATGALAADAATLSGSASHLTLHPSSGALSADSATLAGTATHLTLHTATGALAADAATVAGSASLTSTGSFSATGDLSADVATLAGTAAHYTLHTATGAIAADAATLAGAATHLTLHTATGALIADAASVSGVAVHSGDGAVIEVRNVGAGKSRRKSQRYVLAIDGKDVIVSDYAEAQALIDRAKEEAEAKAEEAQRRANASQRRPIGKVIRDARKALKAPSIEAPPELEDYARKVIADIQATYDQRLKDIEITALMRQRERQQEEDDEEVLMLIA